MASVSIPKYQSFHDRMLNIDRFWTTGPNWPKNGEIDIIEGVNDQMSNSMTLHTGPGCTIGSDTTQFAGNVTTKNCDVKAKGQMDNAGCSIADRSTKSYGAGLNANGGGVYATQWTSDAISVFFFPRGSVPEDVLGDNPDPSGWGKPSAKFEGGCDIEDTFKQQQIVFDTTFCGVWAGSSSVWGASSCSKKAATCEEWVQNNPEAFAEAYWTVNALKVYQDNGEASAPVPSSAPQQSSAAYIPEPVPTETVVVSSTLAGPTGSPAIPTSAIKPSVSSVAVPIPTSETVSAPASAPIVTPPAYGAPSAPSVPDASSPPVESPTASEIADGAKPVAPPTQIAAPAPGPAPTGAGGMPGFQWPTGAGGSNDNDTAPTSAPAVSPPQNTGTPTQNSSDAATVPSPTQGIPQPSGPAAAPEAPVPAPAPTSPAIAPVAAPVVPVVTDTVQAVYTVYETVYATVTASPTETPAPAAAPPAARNVRMARFLREHRQRITRHHAKF